MGRGAGGGGVVVECDGWQQGQGDCALDPAWESSHPELQAQRDLIQAPRAQPGCVETIGVGVYTVRRAAREGIWKCIGSNLKPPPLLKGPVSQHLQMTAKRKPA